MGVGQVISDTFGIVKGRFGPLLGLWAIFFGITMLLFVVFAIGVGAAGIVGLNSMAESNLLAAGGGMLVLVVLLYVGYLLVAMAQYASLIVMGSPLDRPTFGAALSAGWRAAPALLLLMVVMLLGYVALAIVFGLASAALGDAGALLMLVLLPVLIWIGCRLAPLFAVVAVDRVRNPFTAIARSWRLTQGHALTIFLASLVFLVILLLVCGVLLLPSMGLLASMADPANLAAAAEPALGGMLLFLLGVVAASVLFNVCYCAFMAVLHGTLTGAGGDAAAEAFA